MALRRFTAVESPKPPPCACQIFELLFCLWKPSIQPSYFTFKRLHAPSLQIRQAFYLYGHQQELWLQKSRRYSIHRRRFLLFACFFVMSLPTEISNPEPKLFIGHLTAAGLRTFPALWRHATMQQNALFLRSRTLKSIHGLLLSGIHCTKQLGLSPCLMRP